MAELTYSDALNQAIKEEMRSDETVFIMGESIRGGIYGVTGGLSQESFSSSHMSAVQNRPSSQAPGKQNVVCAAAGWAAASVKMATAAIANTSWIDLSLTIVLPPKMQFRQKDFGHAGSVVRIQACPRSA